ncbi:hypothetical protein C8Q76DRAFT_792326 [Earliella scabrosa]|nr:hypothetical protein C8Q76DRAFT_792326 [Earliella scabrosa]
MAATLIYCYALSRLRHFFHPLASLLISPMDTAPPAHPPPLNPFHTLFLGDDFPAAALGSEPLKFDFSEFVTLCTEPHGQLGDSTIQCLEHYKTKSGPLHEFLAITIRWSAPEHSVVGYVVLDRNAGDPVKMTPVAQRFRNSAIVSSPHVAQDSVTVCPTKADIDIAMGHRPYKLIKKHTPEVPLPITRLAAAGSLYIKGYPVYYLLGANCYSFAAFISLLSVHQEFAESLKPIMSHYEAIKLP